MKLNLLWLASVALAQLALAAPRAEPGKLQLSRLPLPEKLRSVKPGKSRLQDVRRLLGKPGSRKDQTEFFVSAGKTYDTTIGYESNGSVRYVFFEFPQKLSRPLMQLFHVTDTELQRARNQIEDLPHSHEKGRFFYITRPEEGFRLKIANRESLDILDVLVWEKGKPLP